MKIIDNVNDLLKDDLIEVIYDNSKVAITTYCFSIYAYQELKAELDKIEELKFIFTSPHLLRRLRKKKENLHTPLGGANLKMGMHKS